MRLKNKVAIITGGANGLGFAAAKRFVDEGANVVIADFNREAGEKAASELGESVAFVHVDVGNYDSAKQMAQATIETFGKIDILINNAGIIRDAMLHKMTEENFDAVINVNLKGVFNCTQAVIPHMMEAQYGRIISTSSVVGVYGNIGQTNYAAAKAGLIGMTKSWAKELGRKNITVNAVAPGFIRTSIIESIPQNVIEKLQKMVLLGDLGETEDVANAYLFLASDEAKYITGHTLHVDGGIMM